MDRFDPGPHGEGGRFVDERQHLMPVALRDGDVRQALDRHRRHAGTSHSTSDRPRRFERRRRFSDLALRQLREREHPQRECVFRGFGLAVEKVSRPQEARDRHGLLEHLHVLARLLQRHARGPSANPGVGERDLGSLQRVQEPGIVAHPTARPCQPLQLLGLERLFGVGIEQRGPSSSPVVATVRRACVLEERLASCHGISLSRALRPGTRHTRTRAMGVCPS